MKNLLNPQLLLFLLLFSCGKSPSGQNNPSQSNNTNKSTFSNDMKILNSKIDDRYDSVGKGFNSITGLVMERCLENDNVQFVLEPSSNISYEENLNSEQLLSKLGIGVNANIPLAISGVPLTFSPEVQYSNEHSSTSLARTAYLTIEIYKGYNQLGKKELNSEYKLKDIHYKSLKNSNSDFFNICGDEIVVKQRVKAQLLITAKFTFADLKTKSEFETAMGVSLPNPFNLILKKENTSPAESQEIKLEPVKKESKLNTVLSSFKDVLKRSEGMSPSIKGKINTLKHETLQNISISIKAIQIGGNPSRLSGLLTSSCNLSEGGTCDVLFSSIQKYAAIDFPEQLKESLESNDPNTNKNFYLDNSERALYGNYIILGPDNKNVSNEITKYTDGSLEFTQLKLKVQKDIRSSFQNYLKGKNIQNSKSFNLLANDEIYLVNSTTDQAENNLYSLFRFLNKCFNDVKICQNDYVNNKKLFYKDFDKNFDDIRSWSLIASTQANWQPVRYVLGLFNSDRISQDFLMTSYLKGYSALFIKYLDKNRNKVTSEKFSGMNLATSFRCHDWLSDALGKEWLHEVSANVVIPISNSLTDACGSKSAFACTHNSDLEKIGQFFLEIWAQ